MTAAIEVLNRTSHEIDINALLREAPAIELSADKPQVLIIHTHSSEAYSETSSSRTLDKDLNVIKVGKVLAEELRNQGLNVIHDTGIYDYPSYSGSYSRSLEAVKKYLNEYPEIQIVFDVHRDSMTLNDGSKYRTQYNLGEFSSAQVMLLVATGEAGLEHQLEGKPEIRTSAAKIHGGQLSRTGPPSVHIGRAVQSAHSARLHTGRNRHRRQLN